MILIGQCATQPNIYFAREQIELFLNCVRGSSFSEKNWNLEPCAV